MHIGGETLARRVHTIILGAGKHGLFDKDSWRWFSFNNGVYPVRFVSIAVENKYE